MSALLDDIKVKKFLTTLKHYSDFCIAGGAALQYASNTETSDIDVYLEKELTKKELLSLQKGLSHCCKAIYDSVKESVLIFLLDNDVKIELILFISGSPKQIVETFDIPACKIAVKPNFNSLGAIENYSVIDHRPDKDLFVPTKIDLKTLDRLVKYLERYNIKNKEFVEAIYKAIVDNLATEKIVLDYYLNSVANITIDSLLVSFAANAISKKDNNKNIKTACRDALDYIRAKHPYLLI